MTDVLTKDDVLVLIKQAVDERGPDFVYRPQGTQPDYVHVEDDGTIHCGCLVALAFSHHGVPVETMTNWHGDIEDIYDTYQTNPASIGLPSLDIEAWAALKEAQYAQDCGIPWGQALGLAEAARAPQGDLEAYYWWKHEEGAA